MAYVPVSMVVSAEQLLNTQRRLERVLAAKVRYQSLTVRNMVATCWLGVVDLNLAAVATTMYGRLGIWTPKSNDRGKKVGYMNEMSGTDQKFPSCVSRCREMGTTSSIFSSGQLVIGGAKSPEIALMSAWLCAKRIRGDLGYNAKVFNFRVQNVVTTFGLGFRFNQSLFYHDHHKDCGWDPDEFRGLSWEVDADHRCILFDTGNAVLTGGETFDELRDVYNKALPELIKYEEGREYRSYDPATLIRPEGNREKKKNTLLKNRKDRLLTSSYKKSEASYLERIRERNAASGANDAVVVPASSSSRAATATKDGAKLAQRTKARKRRAERKAAAAAAAGNKKPRINHPSASAPSGPRFEWTRNQFSSLLTMVQSGPVATSAGPTGPLPLPPPVSQARLPVVLPAQIPKTSSVKGRRPASALGTSGAARASGAVSHTIMLGPNQTVVPWKHMGPMQSAHSRSVTKP